MRLSSDILLSGGWIKAKIDNATCGSSDPSIVGSLFRDQFGSNFGCFIIFFGVNFAIHAEFYAAAYAVEIVYLCNWHNFWLACDLKLVVDAFHSNYKVLWSLAT
ncbi:hypothetical protein MTR_4g070800 [Medicago truncatula]|uniref:Uncharacterized protein n=1 Tax=Medicago truncatula TaxID=3880 RepID=G7JHG1_MEDTR|nr:hypothetical protein MTR_4g070800 [Medicago truncatula]